MFVGADHQIADFFGVAPAVKALSSFSSCLLASLLVGDVGLFVSSAWGVEAL